MYKETIVHGTVGHGDFCSRRFLKVKGLLKSNFVKLSRPPKPANQPLVLAPSPDIRIAYYYSYYYAVANLICLLIVSMSVKSHNLSELVNYPATQPHSGKVNTRLGNKSNYN